MKQSRAATSQIRTRWTNEDDGFG